jgi:hypothetical protein
MFPHPYTLRSTSIVEVDHSTNILIYLFFGGGSKKVMLPPPYTLRSTSIVAGWIVVLIRYLRSVQYVWYVPSVVYW